MRYDFWPILLLFFLPIVTFAQGARTDTVLSEIKNLALEYARLSETLKGPSPSPLATKTTTLARMDTRSKLLKKTLELQSIYGDDDRQNIFDKHLVLPMVITEKAFAATVALVNRRLLEKNPGGSFNLPSTTKGFCSPDQIIELNRNKGNIFKEQSFWDEPAPAFCTGFKVGADLIATAGHCVKSPFTPYGLKPCEEIAVIVNFSKLTVSHKPEKHIGAKRVYQCEEVVGGEQIGLGSDWSVFRVDRTIDGPTVDIRKSGAPTIKENERVVIVGHPTGIPAKIDAGGRVLPGGFGDRKSTFRVSVDSFESNSGSPIFNFDKLMEGKLFVEGILAGGSRDYQQIEPCRISKRCTNTGGDQCEGERVTFASEIEEAIK